jgi:hypothetical protein
VLGVHTGRPLGWIAVSVPLAAVLTPARATWDATGCPAGIYTVTSTAQRVGTGETYFATSTGIQLPRSTFIQEFTNLPSGAYSVSAKVQGNNGAVFSARPQTIQSDQGATVSSGQRGPAVTMPSATGVARPRGRPGQSTGVTGAGTNTTPSASQPIVTGPAAAGPERSLLEIRRLLDRAGAPDWRRIEVIDADGDGVIDGAAIEMAAGDIYILMVRRR